MARIGENIEIYEGKRRCFSWSAVFIGALVMTGLGFLLNLFGIAISLSAFTTKAGSMTFAVGGFLAMLIGTIVIMFVGGWVAGYFARSHTPQRNLGAAYGFTAWCLGLIFALFLAGPMHHFVFHYSYDLTNPAVVRMSHATEVATGETKINFTSNAPKVVTVNTDQMTSHITAIVFTAFVLFFLGAVASSFGGHFGMNYRKDEAST